MKPDADKALTFAQLSELLSFDSETGELRWLKGITRGRVAGGPNDRGYLRVMVGQASYKAHRLAWMLHYGSWPNGVVDHINQDKADNRIANLRVLTDAENKQNQSGPRVHSKTRIRGVRVGCGGKFIASIGINGKVRHLGTFLSARDAEIAYQSARRMLHPCSPEAA